MNRLIIFLSLSFFSCTVHQNDQTNLYGKRPNILFCIADDASFPHMSAYGCSWVKTPGFDTVAKNGIMFMNAYTPNAKCGPSRSCILSGRNSWQLETAANHVADYPDKFQTFPEALQESGYFVGVTGKGLRPMRVSPGRQVIGKVFDDRRLKTPTSHMSTIDYSANFEEFFNEKPKNKPFCFWYGGFEPHRTYEYGSGSKIGKKKLEEIDRVFSFWPDNEVVRQDMLDYAFELEYFDNHLLQMMEFLKEKGEFNNTIIIVTSDNGMPFPRIKGQNYELSNHLPLAIMWPEGIKHKNRTITDFVSFIDFAPTFLDVAGISESSRKLKSSGKSLLKLLASNKSGQIDPTRDHVLIGKERHDVGRPNDWGYPTRGIVKGDYLYIHNMAHDRWPSGHPYTGYMNCDGSPTKTECLKARPISSTYKFWELSLGKRDEYEFFNIKKDPDCVNNLFADLSQRKKINELKTQMIEELKAQGDPRMFGKGEFFDNIVYYEEPNSNYYTKFMRGDDIAAGWINPSDVDKRGVTNNTKGSK